VESPLRPRDGYFVSMGFEAALAFYAAVWFLFHLPAADGTHRAEQSLLAVRHPVPLRQLSNAPPQTSLNLAESHHGFLVP